VVDDEESIREIVSSMLTTAGYRCHQAGFPVTKLSPCSNPAEKFELIAFRF